VEGENAEKLTVNTEGGETKLENSAGEDLPEAGPVTGLINANSNIADLEKKSTEEPEGGSDESTRVTEGENLPKTDDEVRIGELLKERSELLEKIEELSRGHEESSPVLTVDAEVKSIEPNGGAGDNHGYTVRVEPIGGDNLPFGFSLGQIKSAAAKKLAVGKKYHIAVTEA